MGYRVRVCDVTSTAWRRGEATRPAANFDLTRQFKNFYKAFDGQLPSLLAQRLFDTSEVSLVTSRHRRTPRFHRVEVVLFALPFPANQIVSVLVLDFDLDKFEQKDDGFLLKACAKDAVRLAGRAVEKIVDELAEGVGADRIAAANPDEPSGNGSRERHSLVFVDGIDTKQLPDKADQTIRGVLYDLRWPFRPEFTDLRRPASLNQDTTSYAAVTQYSSFFYGQAGAEREVENSILLTTIQAVGTAARFNRIWRDAYFQVQDFQKKKQAPRSGRQTRKELETLADEMGNLELDLAFSVETAADLGLGSATARIDDFHQELYEAMQIKTRATTVGQMFTRLNSSIASELTAIESREKELEDQRRFRGALALGALSFILAPMGLILGFFGANASEIDEDDSMFDFRHYWVIYAVAATIMIVSAAFSVSYSRLLLRDHARSAEGDGGQAPPATAPKESRRTAPPKR